MAWSIPRYSKARVDAAGATLIKADFLTPNYSAFEYAEALEVINNWRSSHSFPLNTFQSGLRRQSAKVDSNTLVAQRIKRLSSIVLKLSRFPSIRLSQMQDIGGCRAVVPHVLQVDRLVSIYTKSDIKHKLDHIDDYIRKPKASGYRGIHLIYRYFSDRKETYNGLKIEVQLRSTLQHAWATAVETVGTFTRQALKSSLGEEDWLRFFALMGAAIALRERTDPVPETPTAKTALRRDLRHYAKLLDVEKHLRAYGHALQTLEEQAEHAHYFLLELDPDAMTVKITGYKNRELQRASSDYLTVEKRIAGSGSDAVLVSVESLAALRRAYPNYFLDTHVFIQAVTMAVA